MTNKGYRYQVSEETSLLHHIDRAGRKLPVSAWVSKDVKDSVVALVLKHDVSLRQAEFRNGLREREAFELVLEHLYARQQKAVRAALIMRGAA